MLRPGRLIEFPLLRALICAAISVVSFLVASVAVAAEKIDPMEEYKRWQQQTRAVTMYVECEYVAKDSASKKGPNPRQIYTFVRRDLNRVDHAGRGEMRRAKYWTREIASDNQYLSYRTPNNKRQPKYGTLYPDHGEVLSDVGAGGALDGYFVGSDGLSLVELLKSPGSQVHLAGIVNISGEPCRVVTATTPYGKLQLWLSVRQHYVPLRVTYSKEPTDRWQGTKTLKSENPGDEGTAINAWNATLTDVVLSKVGDTFIPAGGKLVMKWTREDGQASSQEAFYLRRDFDLKPDYAKDPDAFAFDLEEGLEIDNQLPSAEGKTYIWKGGQVVEGVPPLRLAKASSNWPEFVQKWSWLDYGMIALDIAVVGLIAWFILPKLTRPKQPQSPPASKPSPSPSGRGPG